MASEATTLQSDVLKALRIPNRGGGYPAQAPGDEEGTAQTNESRPNADCNSWRFHDN